MIAWWGWLLIWTGLVLGLAVTLGLFGWWLFRKAMRLLDDVADLADTAAVLDIEEPVLPRQTIAVLEDLRDIRAQRDARRMHNSRRRNDRRRRRLERARRITSAAASQQQWPADWR